MTATAVVGPSDVRPILSFAGDSYRFLATGDETGGRYALWESLVPPGGGPPLHTHSREHESFYVLEGQVTFEVDGATVVLGPGGFANLAPGVKHAFRNRGDRTARMLIQVAPAGLERMFFEVGTPLAAGAPPLPPSPAEIERLLGVVERYGITLFLPAAH